MGRDAFHVLDVTGFLRRRTCASRSKSPSASNGYFSANLVRIIGFRRDMPVLKLEDRDPLWMLVREYTHRSSILLFRGISLNPQARINKVVLERGVYWTKTMCTTLSH